MIFSKLPMDLIYMILLYDEHFIMRKGKIVSIIPKSDYRYKLLSFITLDIGYIVKDYNRTRYNYNFKNVYNYEERKINNSDIIQVDIRESKNGIKYSIWTGRQYPQSFCNKDQSFLVESTDYGWKYIQYEYTR